VAVALLLAAGRGERLGAGGPKALVRIGGRSLLSFSLDVLRAVPAVGSVVVALPPGVGAPAGALGVSGGASRSASVRAALAAAPPDPEILVHDAARPLVSAELAERVLAALVDCDAAVAAARVSDTIKECAPDGRVVATPARERLWAVQTPQAFRREALARALEVSEEILAAATDDAWLVERTGGTVRVVESDPANLKVTTPLDRRVAELLLADGKAPSRPPGS
jgi:2-C-methyl-D-erythritol 4-phosphate cytidylyltransferase